MKSETELHYVRKPKVKTRQGRKTEERNNGRIVGTRRRVGKNGIMKMGRTEPNSAAFLSGTRQGWYVHIIFFLP